MIYRLTLAYRGTAYAGWQRQANAVAVQQVVEEALAKLLGEEVRIFGAGRTDAGVHARGQVAHFPLAREFPRRGLVHGVNAFLPEDIRVIDAARMPDDFHALRSALGKRYLYRWSQAEVICPLVAPLVAPLDRRAELPRMMAAADWLVGRHDFSAFALAGGSHRHATRRIFGVGWRRQGPEIWWWIEGEGFLRGMVRSLAGTLEEVGTGRRSVEDFRRLLQGAARGAAGPTAPAHGLVLERVLYSPDVVA
jgi:tRNA pseudouridine38-40 synthase